MKASELRDKNTEDLIQNLTEKLDEKMKLHMQGRGQQSKQSHKFKQVARDIARIKTVLREKYGTE